MKFIGRTQEIQDLERLQKKKSASLIVIRGRRRIGKSRLIREFTRKGKTWTFVGLPPTSHTTRESQIQEFSQQMAKNLEMPPLKSSEMFT